MVKQVIDDSKKPGILAKLSSMNQTFATFRAKFQTAWFVIKQVWYIPFLWSLAWYSYWIFHSTIVLKTPLHEENNLNYIGAGISIAALLITGYNARRPIIKSVKTTFRSLYRRPSQSTQTISKQKNEQEKMHIKPVEAEQIPPAKMKQIPKENPPSRLVLIDENVSSSPSIQEVEQTASTPQDFSSECLTCPNLIDCTYRPKRTVELSTQIGSLTPCPYKPLVKNRNAFKS
jgi:hypothetical protein